MEGNKDESEHCIKLAKHCINSGQKEKAVKYLLKAEKLYPSQTAKDLLELLQKVNGYNMPSHQNGSAAPPESPSLHRRPSNKEVPSERTSTSSTTTTKEYTKEQLVAVQQIKKCKDYYEILGVSKDCDDVELKRQYKRLALQFHPDKNKAPGAAEAFKAIGNAFSVLSDAEKRKKYDLYGSEDVQRNHVHHHHQTDSYDYSRGFESDISAEELFNIFFGGGFNTGANIYTRRGNRWHHYRQNSEPRHENASISSFLQIMPVLFLVFLPLISSFFVTDPPYSLTRTAKYIHERKTHHLKVPYYVKDNFLAEHQSHLHRLEREVEEEKLQQLRASCFREESHKHHLLTRASLTGDLDLEIKAKHFRTPSCDLLREIMQQ